MQDIEHNRRRNLLAGVNLGNVGKEIEDTAGVAPLVVVPGDQLDKVLVEGDAGLGVKDGGVGVAVHVGGDNIVLGVGENALEGAVGSLLDGLLDLVVGSTLLNAGSQVDDGDVGGGNTHGHASELAVEVGDDLADSLGGTGAAGNDVLGSTTATTPVLARGAVDGLLGSRDDDLLGASGQMGLGLVGGGEDTGGLDDILGASGLPGDGRGIALSEELDLLAVDDEAVGLLLDVALEDAVGRVILEHVGLVMANGFQSARRHSQE
ncbi:hypothetical protein VCV18_007252 [Metarhizium anisopliae]